MLVLRSTDTIDVTITLSSAFGTQSKKNYFHTFHFVQEMTCVCRKWLQLLPRSYVLGTRQLYCVVTVLLYYQPICSLSLICSRSFLYESVHVHKNMHLIFLNAFSGKVLVFPNLTNCLLLS